MGNIKSAIKRAQVSERNRLRNKAYKSAVRTLMKKCLVAVDSFGADPAPEKMQEVQRHLANAYSKIDKAVKRGVLHPNTGGRKKSRLARALKRYDPAPTTATAPVTEAAVLASPEADPEAPPVPTE